jgi:AmmeMemoRadiSam system protein A
MLDLRQQKILLEIARNSVEVLLLNAKVKSFEIGDDLKSKQGCFVTIKNNENELRGCIGIIENNTQELDELVRDMAIAAATKDSRFLPIVKNELKDIYFEISILSTPEIVDDWKSIKLGEHGVVIEKGMRSGVFLPQVALESSWSLEEFLAQLCVQKAGLLKDCYKNDKDAVLKVFEAQIFSEKINNNPY